MVFHFIRISLSYLSLSYVSSEILSKLIAISIDSACLIQIFLQEKILTIKTKAHCFKCDLKYDDQNKLSRDVWHSSEAEKNNNEASKFQQIFPSYKAINLKLILNRKKRGKTAWIGFVYNAIYSIPCLNWMLKITTRTEKKVDDKKSAQTFTPTRANTHSHTPEPIKNI